MKGSVINSNDIDNYKNFPVLNMEWNPHLLAHLIKKHGQRLFVLDVGQGYNKITYQIMEVKHE